MLNKGPGMGPHVVKRRKMPRGANTASPSFFDFARHEPRPSTQRAACCGHDRRKSDFDQTAANAENAAASRGTSRVAIGSHYSGDRTSSEGFSVALSLRSDALPSREHLGVSVARSVNFVRNW